MKPKIYFGGNPMQFAPCDANYTTIEQSIKLHPHIIAIRSKRKRTREVKRSARIGMKSFIRPVWEIYPAEQQ